MLLENGLLEHERETQSFRTTQKDLHLLQMYNQFDEMLLIENIKR